MSAPDGSPCYCPACNTAMAWIRACPTCTANQSEADMVWFSHPVKQRARRLADMLVEVERKKQVPAYRIQYVGRCKAVHLFNVDVQVNTTDNNDSCQPQPPTPGATAGRAPPDTPHVNIGSARHVTVQAVSLHVDLAGTRAEIQQVTGTEIKDAVKEGVILAQVKWGSEAVQKYKEKYRQEKQRGVDSKAWFGDQIRSLEAQIRLEQDAGDKELERVKKEGHEQMKSLSKALSVLDYERASSEKQVSELTAKLAQQHKKSQYQVSKLSEDLQRQQREKEEQLSALKECYEQEKQREQKKVIRFVLKLEERDQTILRQLAVGLDTERLVQVAERLFKEKDIRLLGVDSGLSFLLEAPMSQWTSVIEGQLAIQETLSQALPDDVRPSATWSDVTRYSEDDVDIQLGKPMSLMVNPMMVNPMTATPQRVFSFKPKTADDSEEPYITGIVSTQHGTLVMADYNNSKVKVVDLNSPDTVTASITLKEEPYRLALLSESRVAVTTNNKVIYILRIDSEITVQSRVKTERRYWGICAKNDNTLFVGSNKDSKGPARVEIIDYSGHVLRTVIDSNKDKRLSAPDYLCKVSNHVYIPDYRAHAVLKVGVETGRVVEELKHTNMQYPCQVCVDQADNIYIVSGLSHCVWVRSGNGEWRHLLDADQHSEGGNHMPRGVCVTTSGVVVVAWSGAGTVLTGHQLK